MIMKDNQKLRCCLRNHELRKMLVATEIVLIESERNIFCFKTLENMKSMVEKNTGTRNMIIKSDQILYSAKRKTRVRMANFISLFDWRIIMNVPLLNKGVASLRP